CPIRARHHPLLLGSFCNREERLSLDHRHRVSPDCTLPLCRGFTRPVAGTRRAIHKKQDSTGDYTFLALWTCVVVLGVSPQGYLPSGIRIALADDPVRLLSPAVPGQGCGLSLADPGNKRHLSG